MELFEKVCKGLECCTCNEGSGNCPDCKYSKSDNCNYNLMQDALSLLRAQQERIRELEAAQTARVMTLEEVAGRVALEQETPIYMEFGYLANKSGKVIGLIPKYMYFDDDHGLSWDVCEGPDQGKKDGVSLYEYNVIWRCWSSWPTDEQREAVKWDD